MNFNSASLVHIGVRMTLIGLISPGIYLVWGAFSSRYGGDWGGYAAMMGGMCCLFAAALLGTPYLIWYKKTKWAQWAILLAQWAILLALLPIIYWAARLVFDPAEFREYIYWVYLIEAGSWISVCGLLLHIFMKR